MERDQEFVEFVVKSLVDTPDRCQNQSNNRRKRRSHHFGCDAKGYGDDHRSEGATAKAIRTLLRVVGAKNNARVNLKINEPEGSQRGERREERRDERKDSRKSIDDVVNDINV